MVHIFSYDLERERFEDCGAVFDPQSGESPERIHDLVMTGEGWLFAGENDNPRRSGYLWEIRL